jgi:hypothetical protein
MQVGIEPVPDLPRVQPDECLRPRRLRRASSAIRSLMSFPRLGNDVVATGDTYSVLNFFQGAFDIAGLHFREYVVTDARPISPG